ncbi:MAG: cupin domain-containing protein [Saprospiraceae bacterium]|nr:cupin domain-containing protein [Saprospiraceae bacterium]
MTAKLIVRGSILLYVVLGIMACQTTSNPPTEPPIENMKIARLSVGDTTALQQIRNQFVKNNPGYDLSYVESVLELPSQGSNRVVFIQEGGGTASINGQDSSKFSVGDIILLGDAQGITTDSLFSALVFTVPEAPPENIPAFIRPDWDLNITDVPGGCATETNAYRRILLTWLGKVGPYNYHAINAHRVRIMDSFSHYHPKEGGFDEFYLVQMALPEAKILTSAQVRKIEDPTSVDEEEAKGLIESTNLEVGDLVYLPRGVMHRGVGGVLAQVITVPGFIPGSEVGVDHHLRRINQILSLKGAKGLPYNEAASTEAVIK